MSPPKHKAPSSRAAEGLEALRADLGALGVPATEDALAGLAEHLRLVARWNKAVRLVGSVRPEDLRAHALDCAAILRLRLPEGPLLDVGSGAGFPGIPLALLDPERPVILLEPRERRALFLEEAIRRLRLVHVTLRRERFDPLRCPPVALLTGRALLPPLELLEMARASPVPRVMLMTTKRAEPLTLPPPWTVEARDEPVVPGLAHRVNLLCRRDLDP